MYTHSGARKLYLAFRLFYTIALGIRIIDL